MRCGAVRIFVFENPTAQFGAALLKAESSGAVRFVKTFEKSTVPYPHRIKVFDLKKTKA